MNFLCDTPYISCYVRNEFLHNQEKGHGEFTEATLFGFRSEPARVPAFQVMLASGAQWARVPIQAICMAPCEPLPLTECVWWDCYGHYAQVHSFAFLKSHRVSALSRSKAVRQGTYLFTIDWAKDGWSETPDQHKNHHVIALDSPQGPGQGQLIAFPNNRLVWHDESWISPNPSRDWKSPTDSYSAEALCSIGSKD